MLTRSARAARRSTFAEVHEIWTVFLRGQAWTTTQTQHPSKRAFSAAQGKKEPGETTSTSTSASSPPKSETKAPSQRRKYVHPPFPIHKTENIGSFFPTPLATKENQRMQRQGRFKHNPAEWVEHIGPAHDRIAGRKRKSRDTGRASHPLPAVPAKRPSPTSTLPPGQNMPSPSPSRPLPTDPQSLPLTLFLEKRNGHRATNLGLTGTPTSPNEQAVDRQVTLKESCSHPKGQSYVYPRLRDVPPPAPAPTLTGGSSLNLVRHFGPTKRKPQKHVSDQAYLLLAANDDDNK